MSSNGGRTGPAWRHATSILYTREQAKPPDQRTCALCHELVDLALPYRDAAGRINRRSKSADHITLVTNGGALYDPDNLQLAHLECQWKQGGHTRDAQEQARRRRRRRHRTPSRTSRNW